MAPSLSACQSASRTARMARSIEVPKQWGDKPTEGKARACRRRRRKKRAEGRVDLGRLDSKRVMVLITKSVKLK